MYNIDYYNLLVKRTEKRSLDTRYCWIVLYNAKKGTYPTQILKMLDPTDEETVMSPKPFRATMTDGIK